MSENQEKKTMLKVSNVRISFPVGDVLDIGFKEMIIRKLKGQISKREFVAVDDVSFTLEEGDMLGILGSNGAGKSTLSKAIANVIKPVKGTIERGGSVTALLELGAGFDGDLNLYENTLLRGALMGYSRQYIMDKYDEIIRFAELEEFQDRPFKQLSSGMKSRLAFSIACMINPEILILDEVLSVGDGAFKVKSGEKMQEILAQGVTGLLVSHSISQVRQMCNKILWLEQGKQIAFGDDVDTLCDAYERFLYTKELPQGKEEIIRAAKRWRVRKRNLAAKKRAAKLAVQQVANQTAEKK